ncbi:MAG: hypothetical protein ACPGJT_06620, partial [Candidatus Poseidoniaceae archaeon]
DLCHGVNSIVFDASTWMDIDLDGCHDQEDLDIDNDGIENAIDGCDASPLNWLSIPSEDYDQDGCKDDVEDNDDDNDNVDDTQDVICPLSQTNGFVSTSVTDYDGDGCEDTVEDDDNDNDGIQNDIDQCKRMKLDWTSSALSDRDGDGCHDADEDTDDDNDNVDDIDDICTNVDSEMDWTSNELSDFNGNGCRDDGVQNGGYGEDIDDDSDGINDALDQICPKSPLLFSGDLDSDGCKDDEENEVDIDGDGILNDYDNCPTGSQILVDDIDGDGCNNIEDPDDDGDGIDDEDDTCDPNNPQYFSELNWNAKDNPNLDYDQDGCMDDVEDDDNDNDSVNNNQDVDCRFSKTIGFVSTPTTDYDGDGCEDGTEDPDIDNDGVLNLNDNCEPGTLAPVGSWHATEVNDLNNDGCVDSHKASKGDRDLAKQEENEQRILFLLGIALVFLMLVGLIVSGKVKGVTINTGGGSIGNLGMHGSNAVVHGSNSINLDASNRNETQESETQRSAKTKEEE